MITGLVVTAPSNLLQTIAQFDAIRKHLEAQTKALNKVIEATTKPLMDIVAQSQRATKFLIEQYEKSALAKKRKAKVNLTAACNAALGLARKTLREIVSEFAEVFNASLLAVTSPPKLSQHLAANAPNGRATHRLNTGSTRALTIER